MSIETMTWALSAQGLNPESKLVLILIADGASGDGQFKTPVEKICRQANISIDGFDEAVQELSSKQYFEFDDEGAVYLAIPEEQRPQNVTSYRKRPVSKGKAARVFFRDGNACLRCGSRDRLTVDHVIPESKGGNASLDNLQTLCHSCNSWKSVKTIDFRAEGGKQNRRDA